jgi:adenosylmethionine-8-amino-7-oxononanoate aminotransferase
VGKGLGAGYAPLAGVLVREEMYEAIDRGSREFDLGHTWDGAPLPSAVGLAVLDQIDQRGLVDRVRERGPALRDELASAIEGSGLVKEVRGRGFLLGVELVDPRDGVSFLPVELDAAGIVDDTAFEHDLLVTSTHPQADGFAGDQVLLAPAYTSTDAELAEMVERFAATMTKVERRVRAALAGSPS